MPSPLQSNTPDSSVVPSALGASVGLGVAGKTWRDASKIQRGLAAWEQERDALAKQPESVERSLSALQTYANRGREFMHSKILGMHIPYHFSRGVSAASLKYLPAMLEAKLHGPALRNIHGDVEFSAQNLFGDRGARPGQVNRFVDWVGRNPSIRSTRATDKLKYIREHYARFMHDTPGQIQQYLVNTDMHLLPRPHQMHIPDAMRAATGTAHKDMLLPEYVEHLKRQGATPASGAAVNAALSGAADRRMLGFKPHIMEHIRAGRVALPVLKGVAAIGGGLSVLPLINHLRGKEHKPGVTKFAGLLKIAYRSAQLKQDTKDYTPGATVAGVGALVAGKGIHTIARPLDVGITWGEPTVVGKGHAQPGGSLRDMLVQSQTNKALPGYRLTEATRGTDNNIKLEQPTYRGGVQQGTRGVYGRKFDLLFDTGMGTGSPAYIHDATSAMSPLSRFVYNNFRPSSRLGGHVGYMTDIAHNRMVGEDSASMGIRTRGTGTMALLRRKFTPNLFKDTSISYGPESMARPNPGLINYRTNSVATPLVSQASIDSIRNAGSKHDVLNRLLTDKSNQVSDKTRALLESAHAQGKRILVISGSGRGDQVATRALRTQSTLRRMGVGDKVQIVTLGGTSKNFTPLSHILSKHPDIADIGLVKTPGLFPQLAKLGDLHWGSTGTSSLYESLGTDVPLALSRNQGRLGYAGDRHFMENGKPTKHGWRDLEMRFLGGRRAEGLSGSYNPGEFKLSPKGQALSSEHGVSPHQIHQLTAPNLDSWNAGNKALAYTLPGVHEVQTPKSVIKVLMGLGEKDHAAAASRAGNVGNELVASKTTLREGVIPAILKRARRLKAARGAGIAGIGLAGMGAGYSMLRDRKEA